MSHKEKMLNSAYRVKYYHRLFIVFKVFSYVLLVAPCLVLFGINFNKYFPLETTNDKLWLLSCAEVGADNSPAPKTDEGTLYSYWKTHNKNDDRIKINIRTSSPGSWWLRSPSSSAGTYFNLINTIGALTTNSANSSYTFSFAFCI